MMDRIRVTAQCISQAAPHIRPDESEDLRRQITSLQQRCDSQLAVCFSYEQASIFTKDIRLLQELHRLRTTTAHTGSDHLVAIPFSDNDTHEFNVLNVGISENKADEAAPLQEQLQQSFGDFCSHLSSALTHMQARSRLSAQISMNDIQDDSFSHVQIFRSKRVYSMQRAPYCAPDHTCSCCGCPALRFRHVFQHIGACHFSVTARCARFCCGGQCFCLWSVSSCSFDYDVSHHFRTI